MTHQSETGKLQSLFIKRVQDAFIDDQHIDQYWKPLNFLGRPDLKKAIAEYTSFESILKGLGTTIQYLPRDSQVTMDSIYCRDAAIATDEGMIICRMGKPQRSEEPQAEKRAFQQAGIPVLGEIMAPGTLEGGDVAWLDRNTLAVGRGYRTNDEGIRQLENILEKIGVSLIVAQLPHYKGPADVFHLMSILSPLDTDLALVYSPLMPVSFRETLLERGIQLVELPEPEFESMGCNVLALAPRICLTVSGNPLTRKALSDAGCEVIEYQGSEISVKGGGGPTCLTRPLLRQE